MEQNRPAFGKISPGLVFRRLCTYAGCSLLVLVGYLAVMFPVFMLYRKWFMEEEKTGVGAFLGENNFHIWFIVYAAAYIIPLFLFLFHYNSPYKTHILKLTEERAFSVETVKQFLCDTGKYDLLLYCAYMLPLFLPFEDVFDNPFAWIHVHSSIFYIWPIPRIVSYLLAVLCFTLQYTACLYFAGKRWDKKRLHSHRT